MSIWRSLEARTVPGQWCGQCLIATRIAWEYVPTKVKPCLCRPVRVTLCSPSSLQIMPRTIHTLFQLVEAATSVTGDAEPRRFRIRVSYVQIYNEQVMLGL